MIPLEEARAYVLAGCPPLTPRALPIADALGTVLAEPVVAAEAIPPFANSAMDGFAVRAADTASATDDAPAILTVVGTLRAGEAPGASVEPGEAIRIMTGAPLPPGADAVVMVERTVTADDGATVAVGVAVPVGMSVRRAGDDVEPGQAVFDAGAVLSAGHLGVLASLGFTAIEVFPRARVGVFSTGDELVQGSAPLQPGQIRDSNRITLLSLVAQAGCEAVDLGCIPDDEDAITAALRQGAAGCDAVITSGGVSMGDFDLVKVILDRIGDMRWMQVAIRPAKPLAFGTVASDGSPGSDGSDDTDGPVEPVASDGSSGWGGARRVPVFGLPGNPVSSMVSFELFARPALRQMMGHGPDDLDRPAVLAIADEPLRRHADGKVHFARVVSRYDESDAAYHVRSAGGQGSHHLTAMAQADGLAILPDGTSIEPGDRVRVLLVS